MKTTIYFLTYFTTLSICCFADLSNKEGPSLPPPISFEEASNIVTKAYRDFLYRDPDRAGLEMHVDLLIKEGRNEKWLRKQLANSPEAIAHKRYKKETIFSILITLIALSPFIALGMYISRHSNRKRLLQIIFFNVALTLFGVLLVVAIFEVKLRRKHKEYDFFRVGVENPDFRTGEKYIPQIFTTDSDLGFRPVCGPSNYYSEYGTLHNDYNITKPKGVTRLLFIGDSVTHRGQMIKALKELYGEEKYEYWNAGVEAFNTVQEVIFYNKFNKAVQPDHVIMTMVCNDMETTPLAFMSSEKLVLVTPLLPREELNSWLFQHSFMYRNWIGKKVKKYSSQFKDQIRQDLVESLKTFNNELKLSNIKFTVLVLPWLLPVDNCPESATSTQRDFVNIVSNLNLRYFDLAEPVSKAAEQGILVRSSDTLHPNYEIAYFLAQWLKEKGVIDDAVHP